MANFDSGVAGYITGRAVVEVHFPIDYKGREDVKCLHCQYLSSNMRTCQLNKRPVHYPEKYLGSECPLRFEATESEENNG